MKICPVLAELLHADGRTDMTELIAAFASLWPYLKKELQLDGLFVCCRSWLKALLVDFASKVSYCNFVSSWKGVITDGSTVYAGNGLYKFKWSWQQKVVIYCNWNVVPGVGGWNAWRNLSVLLHALCSSVFHRTESPDSVCVACLLSGCQT